MEEQGKIISSKDWREIIDLYFQVKALVALAEISDKKQQLCVSAITEMRSALDHMMRVKHVVILDGQKIPVLAVTNDDPRPKIPEGEKEQGRYCKSNLMKIKGHLYRAAYDSLDALVMSDLADYEKLVGRFDFDDICEALPDFPNNHARIAEARRMVVQCKMFKDIESDKDTAGQMEEKLLGNARVIEDYLRAHEMVKDVSAQIREKALLVRAAVSRRKNAFFKPILIGVIASLLFTIMLAIALWMVQFLPGPHAGKGNAAVTSSVTVQETAIPAPVK